MLVDITKLKDSICNLTNPFYYFIFFILGNVISCIDNIVLVRVRQTSQEMTETLLVSSQLAGLRFNWPHGLACLLWYCWKHLHWPRAGLILKFVERGKFLQIIFHSFSSSIFFLVVSTWKFLSRFPSVPSVLIDFAARVFCLLLSWSSLSESWTAIRSWYLSTLRINYLQHINI